MAMVCCCLGFKREYPLNEIYFHEAAVWESVRAPTLCV